MNAAGIDVSSRKSTVAVLRPFGEVVRLPFDVRHSAEDLAALAEQLKAIEGETRVVMEHTGRYYESVAKVLHEAGLYVSAVNPLLIKEYGNNSLRTSEQSFPGIRKLFDSPVRSDGTQKWVDFTHDFWHVDCVRGGSQNAFAERYRKWCKRNRYQFSTEMYGVGESLRPQLMAEIGDVRRFERKQSLVAFAGIDPAPSESGDYCSRSNKTTKRGSPYLRKTLFNIMKVHLQRAPADEPVFQFLDKKRAEGKPYYVYMTAAGNKFLRRYYGKVMAYFSTLEGLPPVDMDSTGLHHAE